MVSCCGWESVRFERGLQTSFLSLEGFALMGVAIRVLRAGVGWIGREILELHGLWMHDFGRLEDSEVWTWALELDLCALNAPHVHAADEH